VRRRKKYRRVKKYFEKNTFFFEKSTKSTKSRKNEKIKISEILARIFGDVMNLISCLEMSL